MERTSYDVYDAGYKTGNAIARHDLSISPMTAMSFDRIAREVTSGDENGPWARGYTQGYTVAVQRFLQ